jgi:hypothetical protein
MKLLGLTGPIGNGKSAFIEALRQVVPNSQFGEGSIVISEVADHFNSVVKTFASVPTRDDVQAINKLVTVTMHAGLRSATPLDFDREALVFHPDDIKDHPDLYEKLWVYLDLIRQKPDMLGIKITPENKENYRKILQWIGGYVTIKLSRSLWLEELVRRAQTAGDAGCELFIIGGLRFPKDGDVVHAAGGTVIEIQRPGVQETDIDDPTERERKDIQSDTIVYNDGTFEQLGALASALWEDLKQNTLKSEYKAQSF